ncbi:MAG TPA: PepSY-like domain-containing protein [Verrucomicrobiae bacterium]|nr:PepSY-like domain-containing protein [Verrucomicrobiae bacterium]
MKTYLIPLAMAASLLAGCNRTVEQASQDFNALPSEVQKAVRNQAPNAEIAHVDTREENGIQIFEIEFRDSGVNPKLLVSADGRVLNSEGTAKTEGIVGTLEKALTPTGAVGTKISSLPAKVQSTIQAHAPNGEIRDVERNEDEGRVIYTIEFADSGKNPTMKVAEDGTLLQGVP